MSTVEGKKQEKRRALLDAAYELFLERGSAEDQRGGYHQPGQGGQGHVLSLFSG